MNKTTSIIVILIILVGAYFIFSSGGTDEEPFVVEGDEITFAEAGVVTIGTPGAEAGSPVLVYEDQGQPALEAVLRFDARSTCLIEGSAQSCSIFEIPDVLQEQRVAVEGIASDGEVLVRKLTVLREDEIPRLPEVGTTVISWEDATRAIKECRVEGVTQTHALDVYLDMKDGARLRTVSPEIDDVFEVVAGVQEKCGNIYIATE